MIAIDSKLRENQNTGLEMEDPSLAPQVTLSENEDDDDDDKDNAKDNV